MPDTKALAAQDKGSISIKGAGGEVVKISLDQIKRHICKGASDEELFYFMGTCKTWGLNPFKREIHWLPFKDKETGKTTGSAVVGYEVYLSRADATGLLDGWSVEIIEDDARKPIAAEITIHRKDWKNPFKHRVYLDEVRRPGPLWQTRIRFMLEKVSISQGFRLCFSAAMAGLPYTREEIESQPRVELLESTKEVVINGDALLEDAGKSPLDELEAVPVEPKKGMTADELEKALVEAEPVEREAGEDRVDWYKYENMPAERFSPDEITGLCNVLDYPLSGADPVGINKLIKGKYFKMAVERLQKWEQEA